MANPQAENGHVDISNEIVDRLCGVRIPGEAMQVLWFIFRKTYGWHKKEDKISITQFQKATGLKRSNVCSCLNRLLEMNVIYKGSSERDTRGSSQRDTNHIQIYGFQKDFEKWRVVVKKIPSPQKDTKGSPQLDTTLVPKRIPTKENNIKKNNKRKYSTKKILSTEEYIEELKLSPNYSHVNWEHELEDIRLWSLKPENRNRQITPRFILSWVKKIPKPLYFKDKPISKDVHKEDPSWNFLKQAVKEGWK